MCYRYLSLTATSQGKSCNPSFTQAQNFSLRVGRDSVVMVEKDPHYITPKQMVGELLLEDFQIRRDHHLRGSPLYLREISLTSSQNLCLPKFSSLSLSLTSEPKHKKGLALSSRGQPFEYFSRAILSNYPQILL